MPSPLNQNGLWNVREAYRSRNESRYPGGAYNIELLVVGGGGQGGGWFGGGGGGGAGGLVYTNAVAVNAGSCYAITVGAGGAGNDGNGIGMFPGSNTTFCYTDAGVSIIGLRGGAGGPGNGPNPGQCPEPSTCRFGSGGGAGLGGGPGSPSIGPKTGTAGCQNNPVYWGALSQFYGCGNPGGNACEGSPSPCIAPGSGGGGGAGGAGCPFSTPGCPSWPHPTCSGGCGGIGLFFTISGSCIGYAGGGGGAYFGNGYNYIFGGSPGGANPLFPSPTCPQPSRDRFGIANRGGGSGGVDGGICCSHAGSGVVVIRYDGVQRGCGGTVTTSLSPTVQTSHVFTGTGTFQA